MKYDDGIITDLGNAQVVPIPEDFDWSLLEKNDSGKESKVGDFVLHAPKSVKTEERATSTFIVVSNCDERTLNSYSEDAIRKRILGNRYNVGRIIKYKTDLYLEFLDENELEILDQTFPGLTVK